MRDHPLHPMIKQGHILLKTSLYLFFISDRLIHEIYAVPRNEGSCQGAGCGVLILSALLKKAVLVGWGAKWDLSLCALSLDIPVQGIS